MASDTQLSIRHYSQNTGTRFILKHKSPVLNTTVYLVLCALVPQTYSLMCKNVQAIAQLACPTVFRTWYLHIQMIRCSAEQSHAISVTENVFFGHSTRRLFLKA